MYVYIYILIVFFCAEVTSILGLGSKRVKQFTIRTDLHAFRDLHAWVIGVFVFVLEISTVCGLCVIRHNLILGSRFKENIKGLQNKGQRGHIATSLMNFFPSLSSLLV